MVVVAKETIGGGRGACRLLWEERVREFLEADGRGDVCWVLLLEEGEEGDIGVAVEVVES